MASLDLLFCKNSKSAKLEPPYLVDQHIDKSCLIYVQFLDYTKTINNLEAFS